MGRDIQMIYGYCRISTPNQNIDRQVCNILRVYPDATIIKETFTGRCVQRPEWNKLFKKLLPGDTIIFDEVSRMSRSADEGSALYATLYDMGIELIFLKEPHINTTTYKSILTSNKIDKVGTDLDFIIEGINKYLKILSAKQIRMAFETTEKEVEFLRQRTREGIREAKARGSQIGNPKGVTLKTKKSIEAKKIISKHSKTFGGSLSDSEVMKLCGCSRNTYYKYKRELMEGIE
jgi:DNA invertase Pin-like site-specific DNA recombinase